MWSFSSMHCKLKIKYTINFSIKTKTKIQKYNVWYTKSIPKSKSNFGKKLKQNILIPKQH